MRPESLFGRLRIRAGISGLSTVGAFVAAAGLTVTAVSAAAASGRPGDVGKGRHGALRVSEHPALPAALAGSGALTPRPQLPLNTTVMLPTGDRVRVSTSPNGAVQVMPVPVTVHGKLVRPATYLRFTWAGDQYVIPAAAVPYLHSTLDPRLFDVSYLARAHLATTRTGIPVRITYASPAAAEAGLPGLRITRRSGVTATATIRPERAARLGQVLAAHWRAAYNRRSPVPIGRLAGIATITLAPPPGTPPPPASPALAPPHPGVAKGLPFYTLTLKATDLNGKPGTFGGVVQNIDNASLFAQLTCDIPACGTAATGTESLSVPRGTYSLAISVLTPDSSGGYVAALVIKPQVIVHSNTTVTFDARTAIPYRVKLTTRVRASIRVASLGFWRASVSGGGINMLDRNDFGDGPQLAMGLMSLSPNPASFLFADGLRATPTTAITKGSLLFDATTVLANGIFGDPQGQNPAYILDFPHEGSVPSSLTYTVPATDLTTVHESLYGPSSCFPQGQARIGAFAYLRLPGLPRRRVWLGAGREFEVPLGNRTDYWYTSDPKHELWQPLFFCEDSGAEQRYDAARMIAPGQQIREVWNKAPIVPSPAAPPWANLTDFAAGFAGRIGDPRLTVCAACRQDDNGVVNIMPLGESDPAHTSEAFNVGSFSTVVRFYRNGRLAFDSYHPNALNSTIPFGLDLPMLPWPASYRLDWAQTGPPDVSPDPAYGVHTVWTFRSGRAGPPARLPGTEICAPDATRSCSFLPLLFLTYNLALNHHDQAKAGGPEQIRFTVTGQQHAPAPAGVTATVSASFDGGTTWTTPQAATSLGGGKFTTTISQPALTGTDGFVALRVTASDAAGDTVTQTITGAYGLTS